MKNKNKALLIAFLSFFALSGCNSINHEHTYSSSWFYDEKGHFHEDTCGHGTEKDYDSHSFVNDVCTVCGANVSASHVHKYSDWKVDVEPTKTSVGYLERICSSCFNKETYALPMLNENDYECSVKKDGNCTQRKIVQYTYVKFGKSFVFDIETDFGNHSYVNDVCTVCGANVPASHVHKYDDWKVDVEPTKTSAGYLARICADCLNKETSVLPMLNADDYEYSIKKEGNCIQRKIERYTYVKFGKTFIFDVEEDYGCHNYENDSCIICGESAPTVGLKYKLSTDGNYYIVTGIDNEKSDVKNLIIASTINNKPVKVIKSGSLQNCGMEYVYIPESIQTIESIAFVNCKNLTSIKIPSSTTSIGERVFGGCDKLTKIIVDKNNSVYDSRNNCNAIIDTVSNKLIFGCSETVIPEDIEAIGSGAFNDVANLKSVEIPTKVKSIGSYAFAYCKSLTSIFIPKNVSSIFHGVLTGCINLKSIKVAEENIFYDSRNGCNAIIETNSNSLVAGCSETIIPNGVTSINLWAFAYCEKLTSIDIPNSVTYIGQEAFYHCTSLKSINLSNKITSLEPSVFANCESLENIVLPYGLLKIRSSTFYYCKSLKSIVIPDSVIEIDGFIFYECNELTSVTIPSSVKKINGSLFRYCGKLKNLNVDQNNSVYDSRNNCNAIIETKTNKLVSGCQTTKIPDGVSIIGESAFEMCTGLSYVSIPDSVRTIESNAFSCCYQLTTIVIPKSVQSIDKNTFWDARSLAIYYLGTPSDWLSKFGELELSKVSYYSESKPTDTSYSYWHYVNGVPTKW